MSMETSWREQVKSERKRLFGDKVRLPAGVKPPRDRDVLDFVEELRGNRRGGRR